MLAEKNFRDIISAVIIIGLFILAALIIKPVVFSIIFGILLAYIFYPIYKFTLTKIKRENLSALLICILLLIIVLIPILLILNSLINQAINVYLNLQNTDLLIALKEIFPSEASTNLAASLNSFISKTISFFITKFSGFILDLPIIMLQIFVVIFVFFFSLRDGEKAVNYVKSLSPFTKETENKFFKQFKDITNSVLLGQVVIGVLQGVLAGIGYFIFGVPYALFLALLTMFVGIIPIIGPWLVWVPVDIYLFATGRTGAGIGLLIYGLIVISWLDTLIRPVIVSRKTEINPAIVIIGMIGGLFVFGVLGLILGPLILSYVLLITEMYRKSKTESLIFKKPGKKSTNIFLPKDFLKDK